LFAAPNTLNLFKEIEPGKKEKKKKYQERSH